MGSKNIFRNKSFYSITLSVLVSFLFVFAFATSTTTITSSGITTTGTSTALYFNATETGTSSGYMLNGVPYLTNGGDDQNVFLGKEAGYSNTTGTGNFFGGYLVGHNNTTGSANTFIGADGTGEENTTGNENTFIGFYVGRHNTVGNTNLAIGYDLLEYNKYASGLVAIGYNALTNFNPQNSTITAFGDCSTNPGVETQVTHSGTVIDVGALITIIETTNYNNNYTVTNVIDGNNFCIDTVFPSIDDATGVWFRRDQGFNLALGYRAGYVDTYGSYNNFIGYQSGVSNTTGSSNDFIGYQSGYSNTTGVNGVFVGYQSGYSNTNNSDGYGTTFVGYKAGYSNVDADYNTFVGGSTGLHSTGYNNTFVGTGSGIVNTTGQANSFFGAWAGEDNIIGNNNAKFGRWAGGQNVAGSYNALFGDSVMSRNGQTNGGGLVIDDGLNKVRINDVGHGLVDGALIVLRISDRRTISSYHGMECIVTDATSDPDYFITSCDYNGNEENVVWYRIDLDEGMRNTALGHEAGYNNNVGSDNVFLGHQAGYYETGSSKLYISNASTTEMDSLIYGEFDNNILAFNAKVGIGTTTPDQIGNNNSILHVANSAVDTGPLTYALSEGRASVIVEDNFPGVILRSNGNSDHGSTVSFWSYDNIADTRQWNMGGGQNGYFSIGSATNDPNPHAGIYGYAGDGSGVTRLIINPAGNVGIGAGAAEPTERLTVVDSDNYNQYSGTLGVYAQNLSQGISVGFEGITKVGSNPDGDLAIDAKGTGSLILQPNATGGVGIGSAPLYGANFSVDSTGDMSVIMQAASTANYGKIFMLQGAGEAGAWIQISPNTSDFNIGRRKQGNGDIDIMNVSNSTGDISFLNGDVSFSGYIDVQGDTTATSTFAGNLDVAGNIEAAVMYPGDLIFSNNFRFYEDPKPVDGQLATGTQTLKLTNQNGDDIFTIDEFGNLTITGNLAQASATEESVISLGLTWILNQFKTIGVIIADGIVSAREFIAEKVTAKKIVTESIYTNGIEMKDEISGEIYCVKMSNGEIIKNIGTCDGPMSDSSVTPDPVMPTEPSVPPEPTIEPPAEEIPAPTTPEPPVETTPSVEPLPEPTTSTTEIPTPSAEEPTT